MSEWVAGRQIRLSKVVDKVDITSYLGESAIRWILDDEEEILMGREGIKYTHIFYCVGKFSIFSWRDAPELKRNYIFESLYRGGE